MNFKSKRHSFLYSLILILWSLVTSAQWTPVNNGLPYVNGYGPLAVNGNSLFAGTSQGLFMSGDNGNTWTLFALSGHTVGQISFNPPKIFAKVNSGIYFSPDNGASWSNVTNGLTNIYTVMSTGSVTYVGMAPGTIATSSNNGSTWNYPLGGQCGIVSFLSINNTVFAGGCSGTYSSTNSGISWSYCGNGPSIINCLGAQNNNIFAAKYPTGIYMSADNGGSWTARDSGITQQSILALAASNSYVFAGGNIGVFYSLDNGGSWTANNIGLTDLSVGTLTICGSYVFAGTGHGVFRRPLGEFVGMHEFNDKVFPFVLFPNPNNGNFKIALGQLAEGNLKVINDIGEKIYEQKISNSEHEIILEKPAFGVYECILEMKDGAILRSRMIIEH